MAKRAVVLGSGGQLGIELVRVFTEAGYVVTSFQRAELDITNSEAVEQALGSCDPAIVLNAAAYNQVDLAEREPQAALLVNGLAVRNLASVCRQLDAQLVHFSTDYVFDGTLGRPYHESDTTHPLGAYAVSKLAGELYANAYLSNSLVIRTSGVFGPNGVHTARGNFLETMLRLAKGGQPIRVVRDFVASPTYAPALAARTLSLVQAQQCGTYHIGGGQAISWFDYAEMIFRSAGLHPELCPTDGHDQRTPAHRPRFSALANGKMELAGVAPMPSLDEAIHDCLMRRTTLSPVQVSR